MTLDDQIHGIMPEVASLRHRLHRIPELAYEEVKTAQQVREELSRLGIDFVAGVESAPTATIATLGRGSACIALRADIDALPIEEKTGLEYASEHPGRMHACGHDGHTAALLGAARLLKGRESQLPAAVKLIWQPAEEGGGGAQRLVEAGVLDGRVGPEVDAIFALHGWPGLKVGMVATRPGPLLAATDWFSVRFVGEGCHGAFPHLGRDPIAAAAQAVVSLQQVVSREMDPTEPAVVTVGTFNAGTAVNIIPDEAVITGTARTLSDAARERVRRAVLRRCEAAAQGGGCRAEISWTEGYPVTSNDPGMADYVSRVARESLGSERFVPVGRPSMGGEDFSFYAREVPACFFLVGVEPADRDGYPGLHCDRYDFTDEALATAMRMLVELVLRWPERCPQ